jgi:hypothetical protein
MAKLVCVCDGAFCSVLVEDRVNGRVFSVEDGDATCDECAEAEMAAEYESLHAVESGEARERELDRLYHFLD